MVQDAEKYKGEDDKIKKNVEAKNALENYCYSVKHSLTDEKLKDKFKEEEKKMVDDKVRETMDWIEKSKPDAQELEAKQKELE